MRGDGPPFIRLSDSPSARGYYPEAEFLAWLVARPRRVSTAEEKRNAPEGPLLGRVTSAMTRRGRLAAHRREQTSATPAALAQPSSLLISSPQASRGLYDVPLARKPSQ